MQTQRVTRSDDSKFCGVEMPACDLSETDGAAADAEAANSTSAPPLPSVVSVASSPAGGDSSLTGDSALAGGSSSGGGAPESGGSSDDSSPASGGGWPGAQDSSGSAELAGQLGVDARELDALLTRLAADIARRSRSGSGPAPSSAQPTVVLVRRAAKGERVAKADSRVLTSEDGANAGGGSGNGRPAAVIPDGSDDDIIARRLRRAAELERDPSIKQKLWQEYLSYRQNAHAP